MKKNYFHQFPMQLKAEIMKNSTIFICFYEIFSKPHTRDKDKFVIKKKICRGKAKIIKNLKELYLEPSL